MPYEKTRVLIWGKTYPELSNRYTETVCTGGLRENGAPIRLYPVPLRYLDGPQQYKLYEWITVPIDKSTKDTRPESYKIDPARIERGEFVDTDKGTWRRRREMVYRDRSWHFANVGELKAAEKKSKTSIGFVAPGSIDEVQLVQKPDTERIEFDKKKKELQVKKEADFFDPTFKELQYIDHEIRLLWRCAVPCDTCKKNPHDMKVLDWGLLELARRDGWDKAIARMQEISNLHEYEFRLFLGNFHQHPKNFGIIALWYPKVRAQAELELVGA